MALVELNEYFCADGRSFSSVFYRGTGGDQNFGIFTSDGMDVGQQYQRAVTTFNSGFFIGNEDIGRKLLNTEAFVTTEVVGSGVTTFDRNHAGRIRKRDEDPNFTATVSFRVIGGSGKVNGFEWFSEADRFGDVHFLNVNDYSKVATVYGENTRIITGKIKALGWTRRGDKWYRGDDNWWQKPTTWVRVRFTDTITGVSYVSVPHTFVRLDLVSKDPNWAHLSKQCDYHCSCDSYCSCDNHCDDCCEGSE